VIYAGKFVTVNVVPVVATVAVNRENLNKKLFAITFVAVPTTAAELTCTRTCCPATKFDVNPVILFSGIDSVFVSIYPIGFVPAVRNIGEPIVNAVNAALVDVTTLSDTINPKVPAVAVG